MANNELAGPGERGELLELLTGYTRDVGPARTFTAEELRGDFERLTGSSPQGDLIALAAREHLIVATDAGQSNFVVNLPKLGEALGEGF